MHDREPQVQRESAGPSEVAPAPTARIGRKPVVPLQAKLKVGRADDPLEREADLVADQVIRNIRRVGDFSPAPDAAVVDSEDETVSRIRRSSAVPAADAISSFPDIQRISRAALPALADPTGGGALDEHVSQRIQSARGRGGVLPEPLRRSMEASFGQSLDQVRIHTGSQAAELSESVSARAFTTGSDVFFGRGEYKPATEPGQRLIAHELTHVVQQGGAAGPVSRSVSPGSLQRVLNVDAAKAAAKQENSKFARFKKSSLSPVFKAAEGYNKAPNPWNLAMVQTELDYLEGDKYAKYGAAVTPLEASIRADMLAFVERSDVWANSGPWLRSDAVVLESAFDACGTGLAKGKLLYRLAGDVAFKEQAMAANGISKNDAREALVQLGVFEAGTAGHKGGQEVDDLIGDKLAQYVANNLDTRGKITGRIAVLGSADWDVIGRQDYGEDAWVQKRRTLNAFVDRSSDPPRVFINKDRGNAGTAIHEACHMWGHANRPINAFCHNLNEGVTEFFARKVCQSLTPPIARTVYAKQFAIATKLVATIGEDRVTAAFFDGAVAQMSQPFGPTRWANFVQHINDGEYARAEAVLAKVASQSDDDDEDMSGAFSTLFGADA